MITNLRSFGLENETTYLMTNIICMISSNKDINANIPINLTTCLLPLSSTFSTLILPVYITLVQENNWMTWVIQNNGTSAHHLLILPTLLLAKCSLDFPDKTKAIFKRIYNRKIAYEFKWYYFIELSGIIWCVLKWFSWYGIITCTD